jgi:hypothetical protein
MLESSQKEHLNTGEQLTKHAMLFFVTLTYSEMLVFCSSKFERNSIRTKTFADVLSAQGTKPEAMKNEEHAPAT